MKLKIYYDRGLEMFCLKDNWLKPILGDLGFIRKRKVYFQNIPIFKG